MLSKEILTFIETAEAGSFSKAAKERYISTASIMKQINVLEERIGYPLVIRSNKGIKLTAEGKIVYRAAKEMYREANRVKSELKSAIPVKTIRIGTSLLNPANLLVSLWKSLYPNDREYRIKLIPYEDEHNKLMMSFSQLGSHYDFLLNIGESYSILSKASYLEIGREQLQIAVSQNHRLAGFEKITLYDLIGETLVIKENDRNVFLHALERKISHEQLNIKVEQIPNFFDIHTFNSLDETGKALVVLESWAQVHPLVKTIPVDWGVTPCDVSYGLFYAPSISGDALCYLEKLKKALDARQSKEVIEKADGISQ